MSCNPLACESEQLTYSRYFHPCTRRLLRFLWSPRQWWTRWVPHRQCQLTVKRIQKSKLAFSRWRPHDDRKVSPCSQWWGIWITISQAIHPDGILVIDARVIQKGICYNDTIEGYSEIQSISEMLQSNCEIFALMTLIPLFEAAIRPPSVRARELIPDTEVVYSPTPPVCVDICWITVSFSF